MIRKRAIEGGIIRFRWLTELPVVWSASCKSAYIFERREQAETLRSAYPDDFKDSEIISVKSETPRLNEAHRIFLVFEYETEAQADAASEGIEIALNDGRLQDTVGGPPIHRVYQTGDTEPGWSQVQPYVDRLEALMKNGAISDDFLDDLVHDLSSQAPSNINNEGFPRQVGYILIQNARKDLEEEIAAAEIEAIEAIEAKR